MNPHKLEANNMTTTVPQHLRAEYPFIPQLFPLKSGHKQNILDLGDHATKPIMMVHGNPTWSFFYRNLIKEFQNHRRVIVPDHLGCGLSDKPQDYDYSLKNHVNNICEYFEEKIVPALKLNQQKMDLIVHDWGGAIGMGLATRYPEMIDKIVIMNTAAFTDIHIPKRIGICKLPVIGEKLVRHFNAFAWPATFMAVEKPLNKMIKEGFLLPYGNYRDRIATARFVKDIPMDESHPTWETLKSIETKLTHLKGEKLLLWGAKDFCFTTHFYRRWSEFYPDAKKCLLEEAGHYLLEDERERTTQEITQFLSL
tara:strand:- start:65349 stop:66278 length:930 start_codon:yes stop_codon:yes gene_type:complete